MQKWCHPILHMIIEPHEVHIKGNENSKLATHYIYNNNIFMINI